MAIRTGKVHVEHLPELPRSPVELFLDFEGVPDCDSYYLAGLLVCRGSEAEYQSFWADDATGEAAMWSALIERLAAFPDSLVYHYGSYEKKVFATLAKRHSSGVGLSDRLVNVASSVYGKVYFPVRSNGLKPLGRFLGAVWTDPQASGLQSLVWRHRWEMTRDERFRQSLLQYNREDCEALRLLFGRLDQIRRDAASDPRIEFASRPKRHSTETGKAVHGQFERILKSAEEDSSVQEIRIREKGGGGEGCPDEAGKTERASALPPDRSKGQSYGTRETQGAMSKARRGSRAEAEQETGCRGLCVDLIFTRSGCKAVTKYVGIKSRCPKCGEHYNPTAFRGPHSHAFGHGLQAWTIYQRVVLRLPYEIISQVMDHLFGIGLGTSTLVYFVGNLAGYYAPTEAAILQAILKSDFVHVDETESNIRELTTTSGCSPTTSTSCSG